MNDDKSKAEVKWWDKKLLMRSGLVGLAFYGLFWALAERAKPPEGHVFERLPTISGTYKCCEAGGRYSQSWVGGTPVNCLGFSYYHMGTGRNDCGLKEKLNGHTVEVERVLLPAYDGPLPLVSKITSNGQTHYEHSDQRIRELWIFGSNSDAMYLGFVIFLITNFIEFVYSNRQLKKSQEIKK